MGDFRQIHVAAGQALPRNAGNGIYKTCNKVQHQTPKEIIDNFTANEIKQYLSDTDLSVKDIARKFNFEDPSYMARFFRRMTGLAPLDFRNK